MTVTNWYDSLDNACGSHEARPRIYRIDDILSVISTHTCADGTKVLEVWLRDGVDEFGEHYATRFHRGELPSRTPE